MPLDSAHVGDHQRVHTVIRRWHLAWGDGQAIAHERGDTDGDTGPAPTSADRTVGFDLGSRTEPTAVVPS